MPPRDVALAGSDGAEAERLLNSSIKYGAATLGTLMEAAVKRLLDKGGGASNAHRLFTDGERLALARSLAAALATADLLGRVRIRKRLEQERQAPGAAERFSETPAVNPGSARERAAVIASILTAVYGADALRYVKELEGAGATKFAEDGGWDSLLHPRGAHGRFIEKHSAESLSAAHEQIKKALAAPRTAASLKALTEHLALLTTKQLHDLKKAHGLKASGKLKQELIDKLAAKLHATDEAKPEKVAAPKPLNTGPIGERIAADAASHAIAKEMAAHHEEYQKVFVALEAKRGNVYLASAVYDKLCDQLKAARKKDKPALEAAKEHAMKRWSKEIEISDDLRAKRDGAQEQARTRIKELLAVDNAVQIPVVGLAAHPNPESRAAVEKGLAFLSGIVGIGEARQGAIPPIKITNDKSDVASRGHSSAYYRPSTQAVNMPEDSGSGRNAGTAVHEFGHALEYGLPGAQAAAQAFLKHRVGNEPLQKLKDVAGSGYGEWERGRKDDFEKAFDTSAWYVGKEENGNATEIVSMGVEKLYNDPAGFAANDPEYFAFVVGLLHGRLREKP